MGARQQGPPFKIDIVRSYLDIHYRLTGSYEGALVSINGVATRLVINHTLEIWWFRQLNDHQPAPPNLNANAKMLKLRSCLALICCTMMMRMRITKMFWSSISQSPMKKSQTNFILIFLFLYLQV